MIYVSYSKDATKWGHLVINKFEENTNDWDIWDSSEAEISKNFNRDISEDLDEVAALVILATENYFGTSTSELGRLIAQNLLDDLNYNIYVINVDTHMGKKVEWTRNYTSYPTDGRLLIDSSYPDSEVNKAVFEILETLFNDQEVIGDEQKPESDEPHNIINLIEEDETVDIGKIDKKGLTKTTEDVLNKGIAMITIPNNEIPLTTTTILFAYLERGSEQVGTNLERVLSQAIKDNVQEPYVDIFDAYLSALGVRYDRSIPKAAEDAFSPTKVSKLLLSVMERARELAKETTRTDTIHSRHLIAAILEDNQTLGISGAQHRLIEMGLDVEKIRVTMVNHLISNGYEDELWDWHLLGIKTEKGILIRYNTDDTKGPDLIGIENDVKAFAYMVSATSIKPPLSIGLFGDWGSGKTFFMDKLMESVDALSKTALNENKRQQEISIYKKIIQIKFNAWHYVEGNLWASLITHIFKKLYRPTEYVVNEALRERVARDLDKEKEVLKKANDDFNDAKLKLTSDINTLEIVEARLIDEQEQLNEIEINGDFSKLLLPTVKTEVDNFYKAFVISELEKLHIEAPSEDAESLGRTIEELNSIVTDKNSYITPLFYDTDREKRWVYLGVILLLTPIIGYICGFVITTIGYAILQSLTTALGGIATLVTLGVKWLKNQAEWTSRIRLHGQKNRRDLEDRKSKTLSKIEEIKEKILVSQREVVEARNQVDIAQDKYELTEEKLQRIKDNPLASFIEDRAESEDYSKHLGMLALVQNDFEQLSRMMEIENWQLAPPEEDDEKVPWNISDHPKYQNLDEENKGIDRRVNRIILYIDDLDRCPPKTVVDVLQAVHLLLAFHLFIVVVAVDARWIKKSLESRYRELLYLGEESQDDFSKKMFGKASADDYLEKIFQVPYWLRPMNSVASENMINGLIIASSREIERGPSEEGIDKGAEDVRKIEESEQKIQVDETEKTQKNQGLLKDSTSLDGEPIKEPESDTSEDDKIREEPGSLEKEPSLKKPTMNPEFLKIYTDEHIFMKVLSPLLCRSPRALKRFINVYRLIKGCLGEDRINGFLDTSRVPQDYKLVQFLLAVDIGLPSIAEDFFKLILFPDQSTVDENDGTEAEEGKDTYEVRDLDWLMVKMGRVKGIENNQEKKSLEDWIKKQNMDETTFNPEIQQLAQWTPYILRHSIKVPESLWGWVQETEIDS